MSALRELVLSAAGLAVGIVVAEILTGNSKPDEIKERVRQLAGQNTERIR